MNDKDLMTIGERLAEMAQHCAEGSMNRMDHVDISHHRKGCPCERCHYRRRFCDPEGRPYAYD